MPPTEEFVREQDRQYDGHLMDDLLALTVAVEKKRNFGEHWHVVYFQSGILTIEPWELMVRVRNAIAAGANGDGLMSPGAAAAWFDLEPLQTQLVLEVAS